MSYHVKHPMHAIIRPLQWIMQILFDVQVEGLENCEGWKGGILAANHRSYLDPPLVGLYFPGTVDYMAKSELFKIPGFAQLIRFFNAFPVRRGAVDREAMLSAETRLLNGRTLVIFPEGSRSKRVPRPGIGKLALSTRVPILPIKIENTGDSWACFRRKKIMKITYGTVIPPERYAQYSDDREGYRALSAEIIAIIDRIGK